MNKQNQQRAALLTSKIEQAVKSNAVAYAALTKKTKEQMTELINEMRSPYNAVKEVYDNAMEEALKLKRGNENIVAKILEEERQSIPAEKALNSIQDLIEMQSFRDKLAYTPAAQLPSLADGCINEPQINALKSEIARRAEIETNEDLKRALKNSIISIKYEEPTAYIDQFERDLKFSKINNSMPYLNAANAVNSIPMQEDLGFGLVQQAYEISQSVGTRTAAGSNTFFE